MTESERAERVRLLEELDADEADARRAVREQAAHRAGDLAAEKAQREARAEALARLVAEQEGLLTEATACLQKPRETSAAPPEDDRRLLGHERAPARGGRGPAAEAPRALVRQRSRWRPCAALAGRLLQPMAAPFGTVPADPSTRCEDSLRPLDFVPGERGWAHRSGSRRTREGGRGAYGKLPC